MQDWPSCIDTYEVTHPQDVEITLKMLGLGVNESPAHQGHVSLEETQTPPHQLRFSTHHRLLSPRSEGQISWQLKTKKTRDKLSDESYIYLQKNIDRRPSLLEHCNPELVFLSRPLLFKGKKLSVKRQTDIPSILFHRLVCAICFTHHNPKMIWRLVAPHNKCTSDDLCTSLVQKQLNYFHYQKQPTIWYFITVTTIIKWTELV